MHLAEFVDHCMRAVRRVAVNDCTDARCFRNIPVDVPSGRFMTNPCVVRCAYGLDVVARQKDRAATVIAPWLLYNCAYFAQFYSGADYRSRFLVLEARVLRDAINRCIDRVADLECQHPDDIYMLRLSALRFDGLYREWFRIQEEIGRRIAQAVSHCAKAAKHARKAEAIRRAQNYGVTADQLADAAVRLDKLALSILSNTYFAEHAASARLEWMVVQRSFEPDSDPVPDIEEVEGEIRFAEGLLKSVERIVHT